MNNLKHKVQMAIMNNPKTEAYNIDVLDKNGVITLKGSVRSQKVSQIAESLVEKIDGVVSVVNMLKIQSDSENKIKKINIFGMVKK